METRGRWWNGHWGRLARRDIWLMYDGQHWRVRGRLGGDDGRQVNYQFYEEWPAWTMVHRMMETSVGSWRDLTKRLQRDADRRHVD